MLHNLLNFKLSNFKILDFKVKKKLFKQNYAYFKKHANIHQKKRFKYKEYLGRITKTLKLKKESFFARDGMNKIPVFLKEFARI